MNGFALILILLSGLSLSEDDVYIKEPRTEETRKRISEALKGKSRSPSYRFWTEDEIKILAKKYPYANIEELSLELKHTPLAVKVKANRLGLGIKRPRYVTNSWAFVNDNPYKKTLNDTELSYIAGIFDGEGCLNKAQKHYWRMEVVNTFEPLIKYLRNKIPYSTIMIHAFKKGNHNTTYGWRLGDNCKVKALLILLLPYLQVKLAKAQEAIKDIENWMGSQSEL